MGLAEQVGWAGRQPLVLALRDLGLERDVALPDEQQALAGPGMEKRAALGRGEIEVATERVDAFGRLAEQDADVALLDDRLAKVGAQELGDVLGRELQPGVVVACRAGEFLD